MANMPALQAGYVGSNPTFLCINIYLLICTIYTSVVTQ